MSRTAAIEYQTIQNTLPVCLFRWSENSNKLVSLWDMFQIGADNLIQVGRALQQMQDDVRAVIEPQAPFIGTELEHLLSSVGHIKTNSDRLGLVATSGLADWIATDYCKRQHSRGEARTSIEYLSTTFQQELGRQYFFHCDLEHAKYMRAPDTMFTNPPYGHDTSLAFSSSLRDMVLAGNCFGCGFYDAAVFHLMRVLEKGLGALAAAFSEPYQHENWHVIIERIESKIRSIDPIFGANWREKKQFYAEVACEFMFFKEAWRNHVMHGRSEYDEDRAKNIYAHVIAFMQQLTKGGLKEP